MPVNEKKPIEGQLYQRAQYAKGGAGRWYWDYRDHVVLGMFDAADQMILDAGCGEGITLAKLIRNFPGRRVVGVDYMQENVDICRQYGLPVKRGDVYALDFAPNSVDAVLLMEVIEHLQFPEMALREIFRVLRPGGKLVIVFPNDALFKLARLLTLKIREAFYDPGHLKQWTAGEIGRCLEDNGFTISQTRQVPFLWWPASLHGITSARKVVRGGLSVDLKQLDGMAPSQ